MSLVAYGSSGESDGESETEQELTPVVSSSLPAAALNGKHTNTLFSNLPVPKPKSEISSTNVVNKKISVKISIPSLSEFQDEEDYTPVSKKICPSTKGSGLFSVLPPPKNLCTKEVKRSLVPHVLTKTKTEVKKVIKPVLPNTVVHTYNDSDNSDDENPTDFFQLSSTSTVSTNIDSTDHDRYVIPTPESTEEPQVPTVSAQVDTTPQPDYIPMSSNSLELDDEAIQKLVGRKRRKDIPMDIIDVSSEEIMPDSKEWLLKQLTEEQPVKSHRKTNSGNFSAQQKKKHQITYLAYQAKEQELELQNQWASNRLTKRQTQSKYGF